MSVASDRYCEHLRDAGARLIDSRIGDPGFKEGEKVGIVFEGEAAQVLRD